LFVLVIEAGLDGAAAIASYGDATEGQAGGDSEEERLLTGCHGHLPLFGTACVRGLPHRPEIGAVEAAPGIPSP